MKYHSMIIVHSSEVGRGIKGTVHEMECKVHALMGYIG